jgi:phosphotransferase system  glucose/maltose/N-acetylglucosamine-specific IIC component
MPAYLTPEQLAARTRRSLWIALGLVAFILLIFSTTFLRMQSNLATRTAQQAAIAERSS